VVFDIDDTLYLERDYVRSGFNALDGWVESELGLAGFGAAAWAEFELGRRGDIFDRVLVAHGVDVRPSLMTALVERYRRHSPSIGLLPDARACLEGLAGKVMMAGVTDGAPMSQRAKAKVLGLEEWLKPIIFTGELGSGRSKPSPAAFELIEEACGCKGGECVYVADNPDKDFTGPRVLGWVTMRVRRRGGLHFEKASGRDVDVEAADLNGLARVLEGLS